MGRSRDLANLGDYSASSFQIDTITDTSGGNTTSINSTTPTANSNVGKNVIINGAMQIDQRNGGGLLTLTNSSSAYCVDRFQFYRDVGGTFTAQYSTTSPEDLSTSMVITASTGASPSAAQVNFVQQQVEGVNCTRFKWGTSDAKPATLSFWVRSSVTGSFPVGISNNNLTRSYRFDVTISSANTWTYVTKTIPGDTSGTWTTDDSAGIRLYFDLGSGSDYVGTADTWTGTWDIRTSSSMTWGATTGATLYITGVQLEVGSEATEFEHRQYGTELLLCQRYYYQIDCSATPAGYFPGNFTGIAETGSNVLFFMHWPAGGMRSTPTAVQIGGMRMDDIYSTNNPCGSFNSTNLSRFGGILQVAVASGTFVQGRTIRFVANSVSGLGFSAEL